MKQETGVFHREQKREATAESPCHDIFEFQNVSSCALPRKVSPRSKVVASSLTGRARRTELAGGRFRLRFDMNTKHSSSSRQRRAKRRILLRKKRVRHRFKRGDWAHWIAIVVIVIVKYYKSEEETPRRWCITLPMFKSRRVARHVTRNLTRSLDALPGGFHEKKNPWIVIQQPGEEVRRVTQLHFQALRR